MPKLSAGNHGHASKIDASGSSSMADVHMWFRGTGSSDADAGNRPKQSAGWLKITGLAPEATTADVRALFERYYSTVNAVNLATSAGRCKGHAEVSFRMSGERDRALIDLQGTMLLGTRLSLSKHDPNAGAAAPV
jgi:hypothetical protein